MSRSSFNKVLGEICICLAKEGIRLVFHTLRNTPSISRKAHSIETRLNQISYDLTELEKCQNVKEVAFRHNIPVFRSLDETLASTSGKLKYLLGGLMIEGGTYVLFAHKGQGKSTFAMQMGLALARGENLELFSEYNQSAEGNSPLHVIYLDYELSSEQIKERYHGVSSPNFHWMGTCTSSNTSECIKLMETYLQEIPSGENAVMVVDNISKIGGGYIQPIEAKELYARLDELKSRQKELRGRILTIILITHTQKDAKPGTSITQNDYSGAQDIIISADGVFAIGATKFGNDMKLFKVLNNRNSIEPNNVSIIKHVNYPYNYFEIVSEMSEADALAGMTTPNPLSPAKKKKKKYPELTFSEVESMKTMLETVDSCTGKNFTQKKVAKEFGIPESYVSRYLDGRKKCVKDPEPETELEG